MRLEEYTADAICRSMSLSGFVEQPWLRAENPTLRIVLTPSFHPELCITLAQRADSTLLSIVTLLEQFWAQKSMVHLPHEREEVELPAAAFVEISALFASAHAMFDPQRRFVCVDGMGSESCLVSRANTQQLEAHVSEQRATGKYVARTIELAWNSCRQHRIRNALAHAAWYLDVKYPLQDVPPSPPITRIAVLGTPEDRRDYFEMLKATQKQTHETST